MVVEAWEHRSHELNPRSHAKGPEKYDNPSPKRIWEDSRIWRRALLSPTEMKYIQDVPRRLGSGDYANLGHAHGGSAILLADGLMENNLEGTVHTVDLLFVKGCDDRMRAFDVMDRIKKYKGNTVEIAERLANEEFVFLFIDADHVYESVVEDFNNWAPMIKVGGQVAFHDTNQDFSHKAIQDSVEKDANWIERKDLHFHRIRTFERVS
jgi:predicted O-methyltransferase YrrM